MHENDVEKFLKRGLEALERGDTLLALSYLEKAIKIERSPSICSGYAYCVAKERGQITDAISLCEEAIKKEPQNSFHYLNLGRIYLIDNNRAEAIKALREGLKYEENPVIIEILNKLGLRRPPIIKFLKRSNPVNKYLGILFRTKRWKKLLYTSIIFLLIIVTPFIILYNYSEKPEVPFLDLKLEQQTKPSEIGHKAPSNPPDIISELPLSKSEAPFDKTANTSVVRPQDSKSQETKKDIHTLELIAEDTTWIRLTIDEGKPKEMLLNMGDRIKLNAKRAFYLKIGNAGGVRLIFDGKEIEPLGEKGKVITILLPEAPVSTTVTPEKSLENE